MFCFLTIKYDLFFSNSKKGVINDAAIVCITSWADALEISSFLTNRATQGVPVCQEINYNPKFENSLNSIILFYTLPLLSGEIPGDVMEKANTKWFIDMLTF